MSKEHIGSSFDDFLREDGIYEKATSQALKRVVAWQLAQLMKERRISRVEMARRMKTSRTQVNRLLDPANESIQLDTIQRAAEAVGKRINITFEDLVPA
jgi:DNA-binding Xre family transcriptional regulator